MEIIPLLCSPIGSAFERTANGFEPVPKESSYSDKLTSKSAGVTFRAKRRRFSAAASASARLSQKVEAAGPPDPTKGSGRYAPNRGCQRS